MASPRDARKDRGCGQRALIAVFLASREEHTAQLLRQSRCVSNSMQGLCRGELRATQTARNRPWASARGLVCQLDLAERTAFQAVGAATLSQSPKLAFGADENAELIAGLECPEGPVQPRTR